MKQTNLFLPVFLLGASILLLFISCGDDEYKIPDSGVAATFVSSIRGVEAETRAMDNKWSSQDEVGICMLIDKEQYGLTLNSKFIPHQVYSADKSTVLKPANQPIYYPVKGDVKFIAFSPNKAVTVSGSNHTVKYDGFSDQTVQGNMEKVDFIYCKTNTVNSKTNPNVSLHFAHYFSKMVILVETSTGVDKVDLSTLNVTVSNMPGDATVSLADGKITSGTTGLVTIRPNAVSTATRYEAKAIVVPHTGRNDRKLTFEVMIDGGIQNTYEYTLNENYIFQQGKSHVLNFKLTNKNVILTNNRIVDWVNGVSMWEKEYFVMLDTERLYTGAGTSTSTIEFKSNCPSDKKNDLVISYPSWMSGDVYPTFVRAESGYNVYSFNIAFNANIEPVERSGFFYINFGNKYISVPVIQNGGEVDKSYGNCCILAPGGQTRYIYVGDANLHTRFLELPDCVGIGEPITASLVWSDNGVDLVTAETVGVGFAGYVKVTSSSARKEGNALIAVKVNGEIRYSWHIWVTDYDPNQSFVTIKQTQFQEVDYMDRNLGAISSVKGAPGSLGLHYQWARKDPFPGVDITTGTSAVVYYYDDNGVAVSSSDYVNNNLIDRQLTVIESFKNPNRFVKNIVPWLSYTGNYLGLFWGGYYGFFDPCPTGWFVPIRDFYSSFNTDNFTWSDNPAGREYNENGVKIWFPAAGFRDTSGKLSGINTDGRYWSSTIYTENGVPTTRGAALLFQDDLSTNKVKTNYGFNFTFGLTVRCVRDRR